MVYGVLVARVPERTPRVCFFAVFVFSSAPPGPHRQIRWRCTNEEEFCWRAPSWGCPALVPFRQLFCCAGKDRFCSCHQVSPPRILAPFLQCRPLERHSSHRAGHCHVCFHLFFVRRGTRQVEEETRADSNTTPTNQLRQSVYLMTSFCHFFTLCAVPTPEKFSSRCRLSRPSTQLPTQRHEPVPCVEALFRVVAQVPVCLRSAYSAVCDAMPIVALVRRLSWICGQAEERLSRFPHAADAECPVCVSCRVVSQHVESRFSKELSTACKNSSARDRRLLAGPI